MPDIREKEINLHPKYLAIGPLHREFVILSDGSQKMDFASGPALMAASGISLWDQPVGLLSRVSKEFPPEWLIELVQKGFDARGIRQMPGEYDHRMFFGYTGPGIFTNTGPVGFFARHNLPFSPILLNYKSPERQMDPLKSITFISPRSTDIPPEYLDAGAAHLCPMDFTTHSLLQSMLRRGNVRNITLEANPAYLIPEHWNLLSSVVAGLTAFIVEEKDVRLFFRSRSNDLFEIAEAIAKWGCEMVVIQGSDGSKYLFENTTGKKWLIPEYPCEKVNYHSYRSAFGGGLLAGYQSTYQPLDAVLYGAVSESIASQGISPYYMLDSMPGFALARLDRLRELVQEV
jgi:sugar/nucleoside kinase (ribokinase family)